MIAQALAAALIAVATSPALAADRAPADWTIGSTHLVTVAQVIDGDTLRVRGSSGTADVRIHGIDAPEYNQTCRDQAGAAFPCGAEATRLMVTLVHGLVTECRSSRQHGECLRDSERLSCVVLDLDRRWGRPVARCSAAGADLGREMVAAGFARPAYSHDYDVIGALARFQKKGLWAGIFDDPAQVRHGRR